MTAEKPPETNEERKKRILKEARHGDLFHKGCPVCGKLVQSYQPFVSIKKDRVAHNLNLTDSVKVHLECDKGYVVQ